MLLANCGNPPLRYTIRAERGSENEILLSSAGGIRLRLLGVDARDLDIHADRLQIPIYSRVYRVPPLLYLKLEIRNESPQEFTFDRDDFRIVAADGREFPVLDRRTYEQSFTSFSYKRFAYDDLFSFFVVRDPPGRKFLPPPREYYGRRMLPDSPVQIYSGETVIAFLPWMLLPADAREIAFVYLGEPSFRVAAEARTERDEDSFTSRLLR